MIGIAAASLLAAIGLVLLYRQRAGGRGSEQFILGALPLALLFITLPIPFIAVGLVRGFQRLAVEGVGGAAIARGFSLTIARTFWWGYLGVIVTLAAAAGLQFLTSGSVANTTSGGDGAVPSMWRRSILVASSLLFIPVGFLAHFTRGISTLIMSGVTEKRTSDEIGRLSSSISLRCINGVVIGLALSAALLVCVLANVLPRRPEKKDPALTTYSIVVLVIVCGFAVLTLIGLTADIRVFERPLPRLESP